MLNITIRKPIIDIHRLLIMSYVDIHHKLFKFKIKSQQQNKNNRLKGMTLLREVLRSQALNIN